MEIVESTDHKLASIALFVPGYVSKLIDAVLACVARWPTYELATQAQAAQRVVHATLADRCGPRPSKEEAVKRHRSRFSL